MARIQILLIGYLDEPYTAKTAVDEVSAERPEDRMLHAPLADLERALIDTFVHARGFDDEKLAGLPEHERDALLKEASIYASAKLAEVEMRALYLHDIHE